MGFGANVGYKLNHDSESAKNFFASGKNVMLITQASCLLHKVNLNQVIHQPLGVQRKHNFTVFGLSDGTPTVHFNIH